MIRPNPSFKRRTTRFAFLLVLLAIPSLLLARAGGGEGYSGGGGGGHGGGGGDGGGVIWLILQLLRLCIFHPFIGIPLLLIIAAFSYYAYYTGKGSYQSSVIRKANEGGDERRQPQLVERLRQQDPSFDPTVFLPRVQNAFLKVQNAWSNQNLDSVRPFISDAVFERFSLQFEEQKVLGYRNKMEHVEVGACIIADTQSDELFDSVAVRLRAQAVDQKVTLADGRVVSGSSTANEFVEIWSFLRRRGAKSLAGKPGLMEGNCPNCGAAIELNQSANCKYCGALLRSGQFDWVLAEITQESEWAVTEGADAPGVADLRQRDAEFNPQELEDRASVIFWRKAAAERLDSSKPLRKVAIESYCDGFDYAAKSRRGHPRDYLGECAVGSVDLLGILPAGGQAPADGAEPADRALVEVRWSGRQFLVDPSGQNRTPREQSPVRRTLLILSRKPTAKTNPDQSISSAHCPTCGAPENGGASGACEFCGAVLNDGSKTWALAASPDMQDPKASALVRQLRDQSAAAPPPPIPAGSPRVASGGMAPAMVLAWMVKMTLADGVIDERERAMLQAAATQYRVSSDRLAAMLEAAVAGSLDLPQPQGDGETRALIESMARVALADGKLSSEEYALLSATGQRLGLSDYDVKQLLQRTKAQMYGEARDQIRG